MDSVGLYVHIPFCATKCPYCDFYSVKYSSALAEKYVNALLINMGKYKGVTADTLYFGGGTPSLIKPELIGKIIDFARENFSLIGEITLEANPNTLSKERLLQYKAVGINRISMGMQSSNPKELSALGRTHSMIQIENAVNLAVDAGIPNISIDLMLGTPYQTKQSLLDTLSFIKTLPITHISAYMLKIEERTPYFHSDIVSHCADEDLICEMYECLVDTLEENRLCQYEISNFSLKGYESLHNLKYWQGKDYIGFGASAHSFYKGNRFFYKNDITAYINGRGYIIDEDYNDKLSEYILLGLRLKSGINLEYLQNTFHIDISRVKKKLETLQKNGLVAVKNNNVSLTTGGFLLSNSIIVTILNEI